MVVVVTGGTGFLGSNLKKVRPDWLYPSSKEFNLLKTSNVHSYLSSVKPDAVIHLAGLVGGIKKNSESPAIFYHDNMIMNTNIVKGCQLFNVPRLLASLSTCAFPNKVDRYPFTEKDILMGPPAKTNLSYGFTKRAMYIHIKAMREQYGLNYSCFCPSNLYGPGDHFEDEDSHFVAALITKVARAGAEDELVFWGDGRPLRQHLYVEDLCKIIPQLLEEHNTDLPIIVAPDENFTIAESVESLISQIPSRQLQYSFRGGLHGQYRKDGSNRELKKLLPDVEFTKFEEGVLKTYGWYEESICNRD